MRLTVGRRTRCVSPVAQRVYHVVPPDKERLGHMGTRMIRGERFSDVPTAAEAADPRKPWSVYADEADVFILQRRFMTEKAAITWIEKMLVSDKDAHCIAAFGLIKLSKAPAYMNLDAEKRFYKVWEPLLSFEDPDKAPMTPKVRGPISGVGL